MKRRALEWLACPVCGSAFSAEGPDGDEIEEGSLECQQGHSFPVLSGVPRLLESFEGASSAAARSIHESFSREWAHFDYEGDRTWGQSVAERRADFLRHLDLPAESLMDKVVLDAGCGNGVLSMAVSTFGCEVVATDISGSVEAAQRYFAQENERTHFVQSDLMRLAVKPESFDVIYCAGVLHHTPDTRATFESVVKGLAPGGTMFVWLYWRVPGVRARIGEAVRRIVSPLPAPMKHTVIWTLLPQTVFRNRLRAARGAGQRLNSRELLVRMLDSYTPRYRWLHTPEELQQWFRERGFTDIATTERGVEGFGVAARRPSAGA